MSTSQRHDEHPPNTLRAQDMHMGVEPRALPQWRDGAAACGARARG